MAKSEGRITHASDVLSEITPAQLAELRAFDHLEGIDTSNNWHRLEQILSLGFATLANLLIAKGDPLQPDYFTPPKTWRIEKKSHAKTRSAGASTAAVKAHFQRIAAYHNRGRA